MRLRRLLGIIINGSHANNPHNGHIVSSSGELAGNKYTWQQGQEGIIRANVRATAAGLRPTQDATRQHGRQEDSEVWRIQVCKFIDLKHCGVQG